MSTAAEFLAKRVYEAAAGIIDDDRLAAHAGFIDRVRYIDAALLILSESVRLSPHQAIRRCEPIVHTFVCVRAGANHGQTLAGLVRGLHEERRNCSRCCQRRRALRGENSPRRFFHAMSSGTTFAGTTPVNFCCSP